MQAPNRNLLWAQIFVDELARNGLKAVCLAPGSRNTPLVVAFAQHPDIHVYSHIDERCAAFFALGLALASDQPVAVVCSSGTATANFFPAIIEAHYSRVPLLILTADRPPEIRESGANQTVDQVKLYGDHVLWSLDAALPEANPAPATIRSLRTLAARIYAKANGLPKGAVHINFPFRKPLEPIPVETDITQYDDPRPVGVPFTQITRGTLTPDPYQLNIVAGAISQAKRGVIYAGSGASKVINAEQLQQFAEWTGFPVFTDPLSNLRFNIDSDQILGAYDTFLRADKTIQPPDVLIQFGGVPTSQALDDWLNSDSVEFRALISTDGVWTDPNHRIDALIWVENFDPVPLFTNAKVARLSLDLAWREHLQASERAAWEAVEAEKTGDYFDGMVVGDVIDQLPENTVVFVANSLPVRHLDQFSRPNTKNITVYCNRGASGIDGIISTALGTAAAHPDRPFVLITGDLAFYHDMNGLLAINRCGIKATIVLINNDGGGIFYRLPIKDFEPTFTDLFLTPTGLDFEHSAKLYGLEFARTPERAAFLEAFSQSFQSETSHIIEVPTDYQHDDSRRRQVIARTADLLRRETT